MNVGFPVVTIMFDDGLSTVYHNALPLLENFHYRANIAAIGSKISKPGYLTTEQLRELLTKKWDLSDHSYSHINFSKSDSKTIESEIVKNREAIRDLFGYEFMDFVFPKSKVSSLSSKLVLSHYSVAFTGTRQLVGNVLPLEQRLLKRTEISTLEILLYGLRLSTFMEKFRKYLVMLSKENRQEWVVFFTHNVKDKPGLFDASKKAFQQMLEAINSTGVPVKTTTEIIRSI